MKLYSKTGKIGLGALVIAVLLAALLAPCMVAATGENVYRVGPSRAYTSLGQVAAILQPGDTVYVDGGSTYYGTTTFTADGTSGQPIKIIGVTINGQKPVLKGSDTTGANIVVFRGSHYVFDNFEIAGNYHLNPTKVTGRGIYHAADNLTVRRCVVYGAGQGIISSDAGSGSLTVEFCEVYENGEHVGDHNLYLTSDQARYPNAVTTVQFNYIHDANVGIGVKTRARRTNIYFNRIENNASTAIDILGADLGGDDRDTMLDLQEIDPYYGEDYFREDGDIVGNLIISGHGGHYARFGGDGGSGGATRNGTSFARVRMANNTIIDTSDISGNRGIKLSFGMGSLELYNNIVHDPDASLIRNLDPNEYSANNSPGQTTSDLRWLTPDEQYYGANNFFKTGYNNKFLPVDMQVGMLTGLAPGFEDYQAGNYYLDGNSPLVGAATQNTVKAWDDYIYYSNVGGSLVTDNAFRDPLTSVDYLPVEVDTLRALCEKDDLDEAKAAREEQALSIGAYPVYQAVPVVEAVEITPNGGTATQPQQISLSTNTAGTAIYYTLDGTTPTKYDTLYTAPFTVYQSCQVRAVAVKTGHKSSPVAVAGFTINDPFGQIRNNGFEISQNNLNSGTYQVYGDVAQGANTALRRHFDNAYTGTVQVDFLATVSSNQTNTYFTLGKAAFSANNVYTTHRQATVRFQSGGYIFSYTGSNAGTNYLYDADTTYHVRMVCSIQSGASGTQTISMDDGTGMTQIYSGAMNPASSLMDIGSFEITTEGGTVLIERLTIQAA